MTALQELCLRMIIYINDILVIAETKFLMKDYITAVIHLLDDLGFMINHPKLELSPTQEF